LDKEKALHEEHEGERTKNTKWKAANRQYRAKPVSRPLVVPAQCPNAGIAVTLLRGSSFVFFVLFVVQSFDSQI